MTTRCVDPPLSPYPQEQLYNDGCHRPAPETQSTRTRGDAPIAWLPAASTVQKIDSDGLCQVGSGNIASVGTECRPNVCSVRKIRR